MFLHSTDKLSNFLKFPFAFSSLFQVAEEIWVCENETVTKWKGNILDYKDTLKKKIVNENENKSKKK